MNNIIERINVTFPDAKPFDEVIERHVKLLIKDHGLKLDRNIAAVSLCPDELNNPVIEKIREKFGHCFHLGGLTGYPFTGETGFNAFGDHIPDSGTAFIFFGPHMAIDETRLGYVHRPGQQRDTLSCGAAVSAYQSLIEVNAESAHLAPSDDYQQARVRQMIAARLHTIPNLQPELKLIDILFEESHEFIVRQSKRIKERFAAERIFLMGALVVNTPVTMPDYLQVKYFESV